MITYTETRIIQWKDGPRDATITYILNGNQLTVRAVIDGWSGVDFQEFNLSQVTPEEVVQVAKDYSMDNEAIANAELNARRYNYIAPF